MQRRKDSSLQPSPLAPSTYIFTVIKMFIILLMKEKVDI